MRYEGDVDSLYEERFALSDLDDAPWGDEDEWFVPPLMPDDTTYCVVCEKEFEVRDLKPCPDYPDEYLCNEHYDEYCALARKKGVV